ncbi:protein YoaL [Salmonella enterica]
MDRHRRHFTVWPLCACQSGISCHSLSFFFALPH